VPGRDSMVRGSVASEQLEAEAEAEQEVVGSVPSAPAIQ
jgi:hypothetical protein